MTDLVRKSRPKTSPQPSQILSLLDGFVDIPSLLQAGGWGDEPYCGLFGIFALELTKTKKYT